MLRNQATALGGPPQGDGGDLVADESTDGEESVRTGETWQKESVDASFHRACHNLGQWSVFGSVRFIALRHHQRELTDAAHRIRPLQGSEIFASFLL
jgi:hypothetical protein